MHSYLFSNEHDFLIHICINFKIKLHNIYMSVNKKRREMIIEAGLEVEEHVILRNKINIRNYDSDHTRVLI